MLYTTDILQRLHDLLPELRRHHGVESLALFGSAARDELNDQSDIDILVRFAGPATLARYCQVQRLLEATFDRKVDLVTTNGLRPELESAIRRDLLDVT